MEFSNLIVMVHAAGSFTGSAVKGSNQMKITPPPGCHTSQFHHILSHMHVLIHSHIS